MAAPFIALGLNGVNKVIDSHFDKVPDPYLHVHPKKRRQARENIKAREAGAADGGGDSSDQSRSSSPAPEYRGRGDNERYEEPSGENSRYEQDPVYTSRSTLPPRGTYDRRDYEYAPQSSRGYDDGGRYERDQQREIEYGQRSVRNDKYTPGPDYASAYGFSTTTLPPVSRSRPQYRSRSSDDGYHSPTEITTLSRRSRSTHKDKAKDAFKGARGKVDETDQKFFSSTDKGLGALGIGALVGGIAAYKVGKAGKGGKHGLDPVLAGILGATVVGLTANAGEKVYEKKKSATKDGKRGERSRENADSESDGDDDDDYDSRSRYDDRDRYGGRERRRSASR